jgi:oligopeptide/dipeptide ABC transporter ATP-binding protein
VPAPEREPLLAIRDLGVTYPIRSSVLRRVTGHVRAVDGVTLSVQAGETLAVVGESGCGKSSLSRAVVGLTPISAGSIYFEGRDITALPAAARRRLSREIQIVFQDPYASLNPRLTVRQILEEGWLIHPDLVPRARRRDEVARLLELVGLDPSHADRYPHQFSGGQRQRIGIARALAMRPRLIVCDEPVSALDVSIQAQILNLLQDLQREFGLSYLLISHDLSVVRHAADQVAVMYLGSIVESGRCEEVFADPKHPYTRALLSAVPVAFPWRSERAGRMVLGGDLPSPANPPSGCRFRTRCWMAEQRCAEQRPTVVGEHGHEWACHFVPVKEEVA